MLKNCFNNSFLVEIQQENYEFGLVLKEVFVSPYKSTVFLLFSHYLF